MALNHVSFSARDMHETRPKHLPRQLDRRGASVNRRHILALIAACENRMKHDTKRHVETLACRFVRANLQHAIGLDIEYPDLVMDDARIERELDPEKAYREIQDRIAKGSEAKA